MQEENSISIINRTNNKVTGESANALPITLVGKNVALKFFALGFFVAFLFMIILVFTIKRQVVVVDTTGKADTFVEYQLK